MRIDDTILPKEHFDDQSFGGLSPYRNSIGTTRIKRTPHWCPRCGSKNVYKDLRKCMSCGGRLIWWGDDIDYFSNRYEDFYCWYTSIFKFTGWYHSSYFSKKTHAMKLDLRG